MRIAMLWVVQNLKRAFWLHEKMTFWLHKKSINMNMNMNMNSLTSYDLKAFLGLQKEISDIERAINAAYYPVKSPSVSSGLSSVPSDPTSSALYRIDKYKKQKEEKEKNLYELQEKIENELILLDPLTAAVLELHFLKGLTWNETNIQLYKKSGDAARKIYKEWKKEKAE